MTSTTRFFRLANHGIRRIAFARFFATILSVTSAFPALATDLIFDGVLLDRSNAWDSYPSHLFINGRHHIWWCSTSPTPGTTNPLVDGIFYSSKIGTLAPGGWTAPVEVLNHSLSPLATNHLCDPSIAPGPFLYGQQAYSFALYYTYDDGSANGGVNNREGVAFSNNGTSWTPHSSAVIEPDHPFNGTYGAGQGSVAWGPASQALHHVYTDSTYPNNATIRYKSTLDGVIFSPSPSFLNQMAIGHQGNDFALGPGIAYSPVTGHWYGVMDRLDSTPGEILVVRSKERGSLASQWEEIARINSTLTGQAFNNNADFARNADSSLLIDKNGYAYVLLGAGAFGQALGWKVYQIRLRLLTEPSLLSDSFSHLGIARKPGGSLHGTQTELGMRSWVTNGSVVLGNTSGFVTNAIPTGTHLASTPFNLSEVAGQKVSFEADLRDEPGGWSGLGFAESSSGGLFAPGGIWAIINGTAQRKVAIFANGLNGILDIPIPNPEPGFNRVRLEYRPAANTVSVKVNGSVVLSDHALTFTPSIQQISLQMLSAASGGATGILAVGSLAVNPPLDLVFRDGFETGNAQRWSSETP